MFTNKKTRRFFLLMILIALVSSLLTYFYAQEALYLVLAVSILMISSFYLYIKRQQREIRSLSEYLRRISNGEYSLDLRDNEEGELSILKNEIFKVTSKLSEHGALLEEDKEQLRLAISDISHQIKTPLTSMMVMTDLLSEASLPEDRRQEFSGAITRQLERLDWLVSALLTISKIDAGTVDFKREKILVKDLIERVLESFAIPLDIKNIRLRIKGDEEAAYLGDFHWSLEALTNIVKNSIEHTPIDGELSIVYEENPLFTEIRITDSGKGIAKEDLPNLFKRFYKGRGASAESVGIGLAMAHQIVTKQGGDIEIDSRLGEGASFIVKFYQQA